MTKKSAIFAFGIAIALLGHLVDNATRFPVAMRCLSPAYYHAQRGLERVVSGAKLEKNDQDLAYLGAPIVARYIDFIKKSVGQQIDPKKISLQCTEIFLQKQNTFLSSVVLERTIGYSLQWADASAFDAKEPAPLSVSELRKAVEDIKEPNLQKFGTAAFLIGIAVSIIAFRMDNRSVDKPVPG